MIPNVVALAFSYAVGRSSERSGDIRWHLAVVCLIGSGGFLLLPVAATVSLALFLAAVSIITGYTIAYYGPLNTALQNRIGAHAGPLALVTTIGSLGGFFGPTLTGWVMQATGGQWTLAARIFALTTLASAALAIVCVRNLGGARRAARHRAPERALRNRQGDRTMSKDQPGSPSLPAAPAASASARASCASRAGASSCGTAMRLTASRRWTWPTTPRWRPPRPARRRRPADQRRRHRRQPRSGRAQGSRRMGPGDGDQPEWYVPLRACAVRALRGAWWSTSRRWRAW